MPSVKQVLSVIVFAMLQLTRVVDRDLRSSRHCTQQISSAACWSLYGPLLHLVWPTAVLWCQWVIVMMMMMITMTMMMMIILYWCASEYAAMCVHPPLKHLHEYRFGHADVQWYTHIHVLTHTYTSTQTHTDTDRHRHRGRHRQTQTDTDRHRQTQTDRQIQTDTDRQT